MTTRVAVVGAAGRMGSTVCQAVEAAGDLELEESLERYGRGVELLRSLRERLSNAEQKVRVLLDEAGETAVTTDTASAPSTAYLDD